MLPHQGCDLLVGERYLDGKGRACLVGIGKLNNAPETSRGIPGNSQAKAHPALPANVLAAVKVVKHPRPVFRQDADPLVPHLNKQPSILS